jgi:hypothetical protein
MTVFLYKISSLECLTLNPAVVDCVDGPNRWKKRGWT